MAKKRKIIFGSAEAKKLAADIARAEYEAMVASGETEPSMNYRMVKLADCTHVLKCHQCGEIYNFDFEPSLHESGNYFCCYLCLVKWRASNEG